MASARLSFQCILCGFVGEHVGTSHINIEFIPFTCQCAKIFSNRRELLRHQQRQKCRTYRKGIFDSSYIFKSVIVKQSNSVKNPEKTIVPELLTVRTSVDEELDYEDLSPESMTPEELDELDKLLEESP